MRSKPAAEQTWPTKKKGIEGAEAAQCHTTLFGPRKTNSALTDTTILNQNEPGGYGIKEVSP